MAVPFALFCAGIVFLVTARFVGRRRAGWIARAVGIVGWLIVSLVVSTVTRSLRQW